MEGIMQPAGNEGKKIHPHKFAMWMAIGSIFMMFAGLTSAYIVRHGQGNWRSFEFPKIFWVSTAAIVVSSLTFTLGIRAFKQRLIPRYRMLLSATLLLGILFAVCQGFGFYELYHVKQAIVMNGMTDAVNADVVKINGNPSESFLFIIWGLHGAHIIGGIIALLIVFLRAYSSRVKVYNATGLEIVAAYWHFVDILWIYLFVLFLAYQ